MGSDLNAPSPSGPSIEGRAVLHSDVAVAALYVDVERGVYSGMARVDAWGAGRDARMYEGPHPVVSHPPCQAWSKLRNYRLETKRRIGNSVEYFDKAGAEMLCGPVAVHQVRRWGGVLEHPAGSHLWPYCGLPCIGERDAYGVSVEVWQGSYGHPCAKPTWLYICGYPGQVEFRARHDPGGRVEYQNSGVRHITPPAFADLLVGIAARCRRPGVVGRNRRESSVELVVPGRAG